MTGPIGSFTGLGSGIDYQSIVDQTIAVESRPATLIQARIARANAQTAAYKTYSGLLATMEGAASKMRDGTAFGGVSTTVANATSATGRTVLSAAAAAGGSPGSYAVQVRQTAQAEKLSGATFASNQSTLNLAGDFVVNGKAVNVVATDSLAGIRDKINAVNSGSSPSGVSASIVTDSSNTQRIVLTSQKTGATGINLIDGVQGVAKQLGWIDGTQAIKHPTSAGGQSDAFASATTSIASQLGFATAPPIQTVQVGGQNVSIDLGTDSLTSIATKLSALTGISATVQSTTVNGATKYNLDIRNTTSFVDAGNTLEQLGVVANGRSAIAQTLQGGALTAGDASTPANSTTLLSSLWNGGAASGAQVGDTLTMSGTRGDGSAVNLSFTVAAGSTVQDVLMALNNSTNGFGAGTRPAVASIDASGHIVVSDGTAGQSSLGVQIVAHNEGGGRLDLGAFSASSTGRSRELVAGADAQFTVDGVAFTRPTNTVTDAIADTTLTLMAADPTVTANITVERSASIAQSAVQGYIDSYNKIIDFVKQQQTAATGTAANPPLYNDSTLRLERSALSQSMLTTIGGAAPDLATAGMAGIALTKDGQLSLDSTKFQAAFTTRFDDVQKLFMERGTSSNPSLFYSSSTAATRGGSYAVNVTAAASRAEILGTGFSGTYVDDATPDVISVTDLAGNASASVQLSNGMTTAQIVAAMNSAFSTSQPRTVQSAVALNDASGTTPATTVTSLVDLHMGGSPAARILAGDTVGFSGARSDGTSYTGSLSVGSSSTVADLVAGVQSAIGSSGTVSFANGKISVTSSVAGVSPLSLTLTAGNQGGGGFSFGSIDPTAPGHGPLPLTASAVGNQIQITHGSYGSAAGISVAFTPGGSDGSAQLGLAAGTVHGTDVQGTIGGYAATGSAQQLVGSAGTAVDGLSVGYSGTVTGAIGSVGLNEGVGAVVDRLVKTWGDAGGSIPSRQSQLADQIAVQQARLDSFNARMELHRQALLKVYLAMDTTVQQLRAQGASFLASIASSSTNSGK
ncbi:MAG: flagellar filament capping protein FliD [Gemmatimonadaceae bacterium]